MPQSNTTDYDTNTKSISIPYVPFVSQSIAKSITNVCDNVRVAYKNTNKVGGLYSKLKDKQPLDVVYHINCLNCNGGKCYIGTTSQKLYKRRKKHQSDVAKRKQDRSALAYHAVTNNHRFEFDNVRTFST